MLSSNVPAGKLTFLQDIPESFLLLDMSRRLLKPFAYFERILNLPEIVITNKSLTIQTSEFLSKESLQFRRVSTFYNF